MSRVVLSLIEPMYCTYHNQAYATATINDNESIRNWYINEAVMLTCTTKFLTGYSSPQVNILKSSFHYCDYFEKSWIGFRFTGGYINYIIKRLIDEGYYVCYDGVDDFYLEGKSWYNKRHFSHDGMIYGYDTDKKTYLIYAYDLNWVLSKLEIPINSFDKGRVSEMKAGKFGAICGIKPKKDTVRFNPNKALKNISLYLETSTDKHSKTGPMTLKSTQNLVQGEERIYGIDVHDYLIRYVERIADGSIRYEMIDNRAFRLIWEHKKVMLCRIERLEKSFNLGNEFSREYEKIVREANNIRMLYASHCLRRKDSVLPVICKKLKSIKDGEMQILSQLIDRIKGGKHDALGKN